MEEETPNRGNSWNAGVMLAVLVSFMALAYLVVVPHTPSAESGTRLAEVEASSAALSPAAQGDFLTAPNGVVLRVKAKRRPTDVDMPIACVDEDGFYRPVRELAAAGVRLVPAEQRDQAAVLWVNQDPTSCLAFMER